MDCWEHTPRLLFISPEAGCGKTRALTVTDHLVPRPDHVADLTPAGLYHSIDEALELQGRSADDPVRRVRHRLRQRRDGRIRNEEMRRLINAGHDRNEKLTRKIGKKTKQFQLYTPMALAGKMAIYDVPETIRTRSITIPMQRRLPDEKIERWNRHIHAAEAEPMRWLLQCWAELVHSYALDYVGPDRPVLPKGIEDRDADVWEPLLAVAELAGGHWPERARVAAVAAVAADGVKTMPSPGIELLADIKAVFDRLTGRGDPHDDAAGRADELDPRWRRLDGKRLARMLHGYGMKPDQQGPAQRRKVPRDTGGSTSRTPGRATCCPLQRLQRLHRLQTREDDDE